VGVELHAHCLKTRWAPPFQEADIELYWEKGVPKYSGVVKKLVEMGVILQSKGWYKLEEGGKALREQDIVDMLERGELKIKDLLQKT